ncbi:glyoxylate/hydroxypyruvate reductase A [Pseudophaeobacter arcticus]|uniref:Glyoxylate/hydroxypyruvate reductase A n=1 Tax=Pseudophaeobacter arcticus TaxID=385492 RepID=A0ABQ0AJH9_9RHOB|nr:glyoxylate/hydroxypyruvate reductase A [Phaeobacter sp. G2]
MALLVNIGHDGWYRDRELAAELRNLSPGADIRTLEEPGDLAEITMLAVSGLADDLPPQLPNLALVQKLGAGVETIVAHPALAPHVQVTRLKPLEPAREIAQYCLAYVLQGQRNILAHAANQARASWESLEPKENHKTRVGVLGMGHIGGETAALMRDLGFEVHGWSRSAKDMEGVTCHHGAESLEPMLGICDYICAILPSTGETRGLINAQTLAAMKPGATFINAGRGDLVDEAALIADLDRGHLGHAVLDVFCTEPLPEQDPLWAHPQVTITPHISGWHLGEALQDVVENFRRLGAGEDLLHAVDRQRGY